MRIGIDARMYGPTNSGIGRYIAELITHLARIDSAHTFVVFLRQEAFDSFILPNPRWEKVCADISWYSIQEQLQLPQILRSADVDLMHFPHWNIPIMYRGPFVVTIHDLTMFHFAKQDASTHGLIVYWLKDQVHRWLVKSAVRRARHICAPSLYTKQDIMTTLGVKPKKISVTYQAPYPQHDLTPTEKAFPSSMQITTPYVLYVGNAYPHKNLKRLLNAWKDGDFASRGYQLVLVGRESHWYRELGEYANEREIADSVTITGFVSDAVLTTLYTNAAVFVFPSLYEGFGLPPLEAMQMGVPVISSTASCMPEVLGEGAVYFDPHHTEDIVRALEQVLENEDLCTELRQAGAHELQRYSWEQLARQTLACYM